MADLHDCGHARALLRVWLQACQREEREALQVLRGEAARQAGVRHLRQHARLVVQQGGRLAGRTKGGMNQK